MSFRARLAALLLLPVAALGAVACSSNGESDEVSAASAAPASTTTTEPPKAPAPLTGMLVKPESLEHAAVSVKVDNSPQGRPQAGLDKADVLFEEKVEGGVTRFIAVYHSQESELVGPIRSLRTTDAGIVSAVGGVFVFSDGVAITLKTLRGVPVETVSERQGAGPFTYPKGRTRPWATFGKTDELREAGDGEDGNAPQALFSFLPVGSVFAGAPAAKVTVDFGGRTSAALDWDAASGKWLRTTNGTAHNLSDGSRLSFTNVIVQRTSYRLVGYNDSAGNKVDEAVVVSSGEAVVLSNGLQVKAKWSKASPGAPTVYTDAATGQPIALTPGNTLVMLPPSGNAVNVTGPPAVNS